MNGLVVKRWQLGGRRALLWGSVWALTGCSILPEREPVEVYLLPSPALAQNAPPTDTAAATGVTRWPWSLRITRPASAGHLTGRRIAVLPADGRLSVYQGASWNDPAPVLVRNRLLDVFQADDRLEALSSDERILQADFEIDSDLRAFQVEYRNGTPYAVLRLDARLVRTDTGRIVASRRFDVQRPLVDTSVGQAVHALGQTSDALALAVRDWANTQITTIVPLKTQP